MSKSKKKPAHKRRRRGLTRMGRKREKKREPEIAPQGKEEERNRTQGTPAHCQGKRIASQGGDQNVGAEMLPINTGARDEGWEMQEGEEEGS